MKPELYKNKYRIETTRLKNWDYSSSGWYFITVCTKDMQHFFGKIINNEIILSEIGHIAAGSWLAMQRVYKILILDAWVIMPNHTHFLFCLDNPFPEVHQPNKFKKMIKNSVSSIINHFKGRITKYAIKEDIEFMWQAKFYDNIVRDNKGFLNIQNYIINNPQNWKTDKFFST